MTPAGSELGQRAILGVQGAKHDPGSSRKTNKIPLEIGYKSSLRALHTYIVITLKTNEDITNAVRAPVITSLYLKLILQFLRHNKDFSNGTRSQAVTAFKNFRNILALGSFCPRFLLSMSSSRLLII